MKEVLHVCSECYPAAKAGGMGDVLGALPAYLPEHGIKATVVIPKYKNKWFGAQVFTNIKTGTFLLGDQEQSFTIQKLVSKDIAFPFYCIDLPGLFDRDSIYLAEDGHGYKDEPKRNIAFQTAVLEWLLVRYELFDVVHVHDHMTGLIPFFLKFCPRYKRLQSIPSILSIHNGAYRGVFVWNEVKSLLPDYAEEYGGIMDWDGEINSLATALKCAWAVNTVSPSYMLELIKDSDTLTPLYESEVTKCSGILNGIDAELWDPSKDEFLDHHLEGSSRKEWLKFKESNKAFLLNKFKLKGDRPLIGFIGRFANQKGADLFMEAIEEGHKQKLNFNSVILGSGDKELEKQVVKLTKEYPDSVGAEIAYNEKLARQIYAGCDFLIMPSRFEPCGLNQLYAMRYGTIPIASKVGGLKDTVIDIDRNGQGIVIETLTSLGLVTAIERAAELFENKKILSKLISKISQMDYSWSNSAKDYATLYLSSLK